MRYQLNQTFTDTRTNSIATIVDIKYTTNDTLYTVQYGDSDYRRYYSKRFDSIFIPTITNIINSTAIDTTNTILVNFKTRTRINSIEEYMQYSNIA